MNPIKNKEQHAPIFWRSLLVLSVVLSAALGLCAAEPEWWTTRYVVNTNTINDYAAVNQGQVKNIVVKAVAELDADIADGAGETLHSLAATLSGTSAKTNDYAAVNAGQLKAVAKPFFDRLLSVGYTGHPLESGTYPWIGKESAPNDYAMVNIGQVKNLFSFDLANSHIDSDGNKLPDDWEVHYFRHRGVDPNADPDGDGLSNIQEYKSGTDPTMSDSDGDESPDGYEVAHGLNPTVAAIPDTSNATHLCVFTRLE